MEIFSKVHFQPRLLTRSSWWITLMLTASSVTNASDIDQWIDEYNAAGSSLFTLQKTWVKNKFKELINYEAYKKVYIDKDSPTEKRDYCERIFLQFEGNRIRSTHINTVQMWMKKYDSKKSKKKKLEYFKHILKKHFLDYRLYVKEWSSKKSDEKESYLRETFESLRPSQPSLAEPATVEPDDDNASAMPHESEQVEPVLHQEQPIDELKDPGNPDIIHHYTNEKIDQMKQEAYRNGSNQLVGVYSEQIFNCIPKSLGYDGCKALISELLQDWTQRSPIVLQMLEFFNTDTDRLYESMNAYKCVEFLTTQLMERVDPESPKRFPHLYEIPQRIVDLELENRGSGSTLFTTEITLSELAESLANEFGHKVTQIHIARTIELLAIKELDRVSPGEKVGKDTLKTLLYERFSKIAQKWVKNVNGRSVLEYIMPRKIQKTCEKCGETDGLGNFKNLLSGWTSKNCKTCGRLLCNKCCCKKNGQRCCKDSEGCQRYLNDDQSTPQVQYHDLPPEAQTVERGTHPAHVPSSVRHNGATEPKKVPVDWDKVLADYKKQLEESEEPFIPDRSGDSPDRADVMAGIAQMTKQVDEIKEMKGHDLDVVSRESKDVPSKDFSFDVGGFHQETTDTRRLLNGDFSDSSFWQGFLTSLVVLLATFFAYKVLFIRSPPRPSGRKTIHIKKKRSTFFKGTTREKAKTAVRDEVKGAFSTVIRRQLSKLDEN